MNIDFGESRIVIGLLSALAGLIMWIFNLGGKVKSFEKDVSSLQEDVHLIQTSIKDGVEARHNMEVDIGGIQKDVKHMLSAVNRIEGKL